MRRTQQNLYTQMPNELMDILMSKTINASMKAVLVFIARKTYGFHKPTDEISLSQFEKGTKCTRPTVVASLSKLKDAKLIIQLSKGRSKYASSEWKIDLSEWEEKLVKLSELVKNSNNHSASQLVKPPLHTKEKQKKLYNYLKTSSTFKEENLGGRPQPPSESQPKYKPQPQSEVIFASQFKKLKPKLDAKIKEKSFPISTDTNVIFDAILHYIRRYKVECDEDHPLYKEAQLYDCIVGFCKGINLIERAELPVEDTLIRVINRWFDTTDSDPNNLKLSHFIGKRSRIFFNSLKSVCADLGIYWEEEYVDS